MRQYDFSDSRRIYIAGPYTNPDPCVNTNRAIGYSMRIVRLGLIPFIPHLTHFWHTMSPQPYEFWLAYDMEWLRVCHAVLRFPGASSGADKEVAEAQRLGIPVFDSIESLAAYYGLTTPDTERLSDSV